MTDGCCVNRHGFGTCGLPGDLYFLACIHEHGGQREICGGHVAWMTRVGVDCVKCRESTDPHKCAVTLTLVPR